MRAPVAGRGPNVGGVPMGGTRQFGVVYTKGVALCFVKEGRDSCGDCERETARHCM